MNALPLDVLSPGGVAANPSVRPLVGGANAIEIDVSCFAPEMTTQLTLAQFGIGLSAEQ